MMSEDAPLEHWEFHRDAAVEFELQLSLFEKTLESLSREFASLDPTRGPDDFEVVHRRHVVRTAALLFRNRSLQDAIRMMRFQYHVFISYKSDDEAWSKDVEASLKRKQLCVFRAPAAIAPGSDWEDDIFEAMRGSRVVLFLVTHNSLSSEWCSYEVGAARALDKRIVCALRHVATDRLPQALKRFQSLPAQSAKQLKAVIDTIVRYSTEPTP